MTVKKPFITYYVGGNVDRAHIPYLHNKCSERFLFNPKAVSKWKQKGIKQHLHRYDEHMKRRKSYLKKEENPCVE